MSDVLGLLGLAVYIAAVIALAAGITWAVVKLTPTRADREERAQT